MLVQLDAALAALGFARDATSASLTWSGEKSGRTWKIALAPAGRTRYVGEVRVRMRLGYILRVDTSTTVKARVFFVREQYTENTFMRWIYHLRRQTVIDNVPAALGGFHVVARDSHWAQRLLRETGVVAAAAGLLKERASTARAGSVHFGPGSLHYASPILQADDLTPAYLQNVIERLTTIGAGAERTPPPTIVTELTRLEKLSKQHPIAAGIVILSGILALLFAAAAGIILFAMYVRR